MSQNRRDDRDRVLSAESPTMTEGPEAATEGFGPGQGPLVVGRSLGERYQVVGRLGAGGMGEVWRAFDLKLRVEVALKALRAEVATDERRLELLRSEVRAAREVTSPNVCRIYDLVEADGLELVSMEYVDGTTLLEVLREHAPLDPPEAQQIASQFLAGLEAIHEAGLVHRDVKPENIMVTRTGRVVLMDFGLARSAVEGAGSVSGTPAYMAPEQAQGVTDPRSDLFSVGVILAEMVSPEGIKSYPSRQSVWTGIRSEPVQVPDSPWAPVIKRAAAKDPDDRFASARELTRALEEVAFRVHDETGLEPYPGLSSFDEEDAEYFFGREAEVEAVWQKLESAQLLGIIGASGSGKSSFIGAGLVPSAPEGWSIIRCTPGNVGIDSLRESILKEIEQDAQAVKALAGAGDSAVLEAFKAWRQDNHNAVLIVDQFEELFTQNTEEEQRRFAEIVGRVALDADVHVLVSMRDDFLMRCHPHEQLRPMFSELTGLDPPHGSALRRAVVQPALRCGYRFEDEELADEILAEVEGERGALPLLAFALARLWEKRDRENGLITRQAHRDIGGVGGALARHAEALMERLGPERHGIVREIFRNLVTAQGTRVARDTDELLSVFHEPQREVADEVLRELIDDRLLTSYEAPTEDGPGRQRVEIIHESLLRAWPRLVRWQAQDAEGALLRDQLRQAAQTWQEHGSSDDVLWTGSAYREFAVWRERYTGGLSELEEAFARAMTVLATRRRRRRRIAVAAVITALAVGLTVVGSLWRRSVLQQLRADAATLLSQAQVDLESYPSAALAYATASLELSDTEEARLLALEALWKGPTALVVNEDRTWMSAFTPDGRWLVQPIDGSPNIRLVAADGSHNLLDRIDSEDTSRIAVLTDRESGLFLSSGFGGERQSIGLWSAPEGRLLAKHFYESDADLRTAGADSSRQRCLMVVVEHNGEFHVDVLGLDGSYQRLGTVNLESETSDAGSIKLMWEIFPDGRIWATRGHDVFAVDAGVSDLSRPRRMFRQESSIRRFDVDPLARFVATTDEKGVIRLWDIAGSSGSKVVDVPAQERTESVRFTRDGSLLFAITTSESEVRAVWLWTLDGNGPEILRRLQVGTEEIPIWVDPVGLRVAKTPQEPKSRVWSLMAPADAGPLILAQGDTQFIFWPRFSPDGRWFATAADDGLIMWPLDGPHPIVIRRHKARVRGLAFGPDGRWLASASWDGTVRMWPLTGSPPPAGRIVFDGGGELSKLVATADGDRLLVGTENSGVWEMSPATGDSHKVPFFEAGAVEVAFSPDGRLAAAVGGQWFGEKGVVRVWDVASGDEVAILDPRDHRNSYGIEFIDNDVLLTANESVLRRWDLETGETDVVYGGPVFSFVVSEDGQRVVINEFTQDPSAERISSSFVDLATGDMIPLESHGNSAYPVALNAPGTVVATGGVDGIIRVGPTTGQEPQLLLGHEGGISALAVDPRERWIASGGKDGTVRLWPMPDLSKPPLHTLPRAELIAKLKTLTNLRAVRDEESATGWTLTHDPFPGWETVPTW